MVHLVKENQQPIAIKIVVLGIAEHGLHVVDMMDGGMHVIVGVNGKHIHVLQQLELLIGTIQVH